MTPEAHRLEDSNAPRAAEVRVRLAGDWPAAAWVAAGCAFVLLATANGAGYRFGASDQAFYVPAVLRSLDPAAFPRDAPLIDAQARLMLIDDVLGALGRASGLPIEALFLAAYLASLALVWFGLAAIGMHVYRTPWAVLALGAAFTLRHRIPKTSANSLEPYFHPRMLAFALGMLGVAALLRRRHWLTVALVAAAAVVHITTALWFAILLGVALCMLDRRFRRLAVAGAATAVAGLAWALSSGLLHSSFARMDPAWLAAVAGKDSLFATSWPAWAWGANLGLIGLLWTAHLLRARRGAATPEDAALVWGASALVAVFLITLPAVAAAVALPVQLQISRVFWVVDFLALVYGLTLIAGASPAAGSTRTAGADVPAVRASGRVVAAALALMAVSVGRGAYVMLIEHPERALFAASLPDSPWHDAMRWLRNTPADTHVFADPGHAWKYGTSVRVSAGRDVLIEEVKDSAIAIYSREVALRVVERTREVGDFAGLTASHARALARRYDLDYVVTTSDLALPLAYRSGQFRIYQLRDRRDQAEGDLAAGRNPDVCRLRSASACAARKPA